MDEKMRKIFAENLNHYLAINGYSQADLARHMHVSTATTAKWCTAQSIPRLDKIGWTCPTMPSQNQKKAPQMLHALRSVRYGTVVVQHARPAV